RGRSEHVRQRMDEIDDGCPGTEEPSPDRPIVVGTVRDKGTAAGPEQAGRPRGLSHQRREVGPTPPRGHDLPREDRRWGIRGLRRRHFICGLGLRFYYT